ncbi:MAG: hypothetical protein Q9162_000180 [Coniocarpon cinnabarinum]
MDYNLSQRSTSPKSNPPNASSPDYTDGSLERPDIEEQLRILEQERDLFNSRHNSPLASPRRQDTDALSRQVSPDLDASGGTIGNDPHATNYVSSPPMSSTSFMSRGSVRSHTSHRAPRNFATPARFEPNREGRPLDSMMTATTATSPRPGSNHAFAPSITSRSDRSLSIVPSIAPTQDEYRSASVAPSMQPMQDDIHFRSEHPSSFLPNNDGSSIQPSFTQDNHGLEPSVLEFSQASGLDRNASIASTQTIPRSLFRDFDGVHVSPLIDEDIKEEDEEEVEQEQLIGRDGSHHHDTEMDDALRLGSEYEQWFQDQWQQAEEDQHSDGTQQQAHENADGEEMVDDRMDNSGSQAWAEPPPKEGMHFYPAPVPRELNMPKRLSRQLPPEVLAKRRSQVLGAMNVEARKSAVWLPEQNQQESGTQSAEDKKPGSPKHHRKDKSSLANMKNLPPQLRASIFFGHQAVPHDIEMQGGSATATLENMLDASVHGPTATDMGPRHPDAVGKHRPRSSTTSLLDNGGRASRASMLSGQLNERKSNDRLSRASVLSLNRSGSFDNLGGAGNRSSAALSHSRFSFEGKRNSSALDIHASSVHGESKSDLGFNDLRDGEAIETGSVQRSYIGKDGDDKSNVIHIGDDITEEHPDVEQKDEEVEDEPEDDSDAYDEAVHGPPTTLLAELQLRKQKLRQRKRTAVTAFPNGMHSTLLEMDAVAQIEKRRRHKKPTTLAWEDPSAKGTLPEVDDDDVPLGVLFPTRGGLIAKGRNDWDQPLGLLAKREREENEPLSKRRNRLRGFSPRRAVQVQQEQTTPINSAVGPHLGFANEAADKDHSDNEGETLAQRTRRLRSRRALDEAIGHREDNAQSQAFGDDFASEMMSTFGPSTDDRQAAKDKTARNQSQPQATEHEGETLGQRRKRLQAEAAERQASSGSEPRTAPLQPSRSMANLLAQAPQTAFSPRDISAESRLSGLLGENEAKKAQNKQTLADQNYRSSSGMGIEEPLIDVSQHRAAAAEQLNRGGAGQRQSFAPGQFSGLRSRSSMDLLANQPASHMPATSIQNAFALPQPHGNAPTVAGTNFNPVARFGTDLPNFANDPKGGARHNVNRGSMLWNDEHSKRVSMLPRQWTDGSFGASRTYAAQAMARPTFEQTQAANMSDMQRAKIEQWRTSIMQ